MKAKKITKLRKELKTYLVLRSFGMFGDFNYGTRISGKPVPLDHYKEVMARTPKEAAYRYMKRTHALEDFNRWDRKPDETNAMFAKLQILPKDKPYDRFITYWK